MLYYPVCKKYSQLYLKFGEKLKFWRLILSYQRKKYIYIYIILHTLYTYKIFTKIRIFRLEDFFIRSYYMKIIFFQCFCFYYRYIILLLLLKYY